MTGMETLRFEFTGTRSAAAFAPVLVGVVGSGNLEVLIEPSTEPAAATLCRIEVATSARGFASIWEAVLRDFHDRHGFQGLRVSINDMGATPAVVSLRLDQAAAGLRASTP